MRIMQMERRALYNSLRMNWLLEPSIKVESWQVEDYRSMPVTAIFQRLKDKGYVLDKPSYLGLAEAVDTPEELTDDLLADSTLSNSESDQIYLLIFELWRRLLPEKPCLSVFCDELDHIIYAFDTGMIDKTETIQDAIANLEVILSENADRGVDPVDVFESVTSNCANDVENFLYDFIAEQIDNDNNSYASELLDGFTEYVNDVKWFDFLKARLMATNDPAGSDKLIRQLVQESAKHPDLEFNFAILSFLVHGGERSLFAFLVKKTAELLNKEEDFQDLLELCADYYRCLDQDQEEQAILAILKGRPKGNLEALIKKTDPQVSQLIKICK